MEQLHGEVANQNAEAAELIAHRVHGWANALREEFIPREFAPRVHYLNVKPKAKGIALTGAEIAERRNKRPRVRAGKV